LFSAHRFTQKFLMLHKNVLSHSLAFIHVVTINIRRSLYSLYFFLSFEMISHNKHSQFHTNNKIHQINVTLELSFMKIFNSSTRLPFFYSFCFTIAWSLSFKCRSTSLGKNKMRKFISTFYQFCTCREKYILFKIISKYCHGRSLHNS
jgi:hypothetical protein